MALIGWKSCVAEAPVSRTASLVVLGGPVAPWVVSVAMISEYNLCH